MAFEGARACPKQIRWPPDSSGRRTKPPDKLHILRLGTGRRLGLVSQKPVSLRGGGGGGLRRAATCQRASVCKSFLSHALRLLCPSVLPLRAHVLYFWPGGDERSQRARELSTLSRAPIKFEPKKKQF